MQNFKSALQVIHAMRPKKLWLTLMLEQLVQTSGPKLFLGCSEAGIDIAGSQEHRLITTDSTAEIWSDDKNVILAYSSATTNRQGVVGLLMTRKIRNCLLNISSINSRILTVTFQRNPQLTITSIHAPTEAATEDEKEDFYPTLAIHLESIKPHNASLILGDCNT